MSAKQPEKPNGAQPAGRADAAAEKARAAGEPVSGYAAGAVSGIGSAVAREQVPEEAATGGFEIISALVGLAGAAGLAWLASDLIRGTSTRPSTLGRIESLAKYLTGSPRAAERWLSQRNSELGGRSPVELIKQGRADVVLGLLEDTMAGAPG